MHSGFRGQGEKEAKDKRVLACLNFFGVSMIKVSKLVDFNQWIDI